MNNSIPVIKVELQGLKHAVQHSFANEMIQYDEMLQSAMEEALDEEHLANLIKSIAKTEVDNAVKKAVENYFRSGNGWLTVKESAQTELDRAFSYTDAYIENEA